MNDATALISNLPVFLARSAPEPFGLFDSVGQKLAECFGQQHVEQTGDCAQNAEHERRQRLPHQRLRAHQTWRKVAKSQEIIFTDRRRKTKFSIPEEIPLLQRVQNIKILGVTFTNS